MDGYSASFEQIADYVKPFLILRGEACNNALSNFDWSLRESSQRDKMYFWESSNANLSEVKRTEKWRSGFGRQQFR